jgi:hypothetical protein
VLFQQYACEIQSYNFGVETQVSAAKANKPESDNHQIYLTNRHWPSVTYIPEDSGGFCWP